MEPIPCPRCKGRGKTRVECDECMGEGFDYEGNECFSCNGEGRWLDVCPECGGEGVIDV